MNLCCVNCFDDKFLKDYILLTLEIQKSNHLFYMATIWSSFLYTLNTSESLDQKFQNRSTRRILNWNIYLSNISVNS